VHEVTGSRPARKISGASATVLKRALDLAAQAAFLWSSRSFVARSSAVTFETLASVDDRISRLVSALSERPGLAAPLLETEHAAFQSGHAFITAVVALKSGCAHVFDELVARLDSHADLLSPLASAMAWLEYEEVSTHLERLLASSVPAAVRLGVASAVAHRVKPAATLERTLDADDLLLRARALEAAGRLGAANLRSTVRAAVEDEDPTCRFWAAWSTVRLGDLAGIPVLGTFAQANGPFARSACDIALRALEPVQAVRTQARLRASDQALGVFAAGIVGDPVFTDWLITQMETPELARAAGAAFCLMTGRDLRRDDLDGRPPPESPSAKASSGDEAPVEDADADATPKSNGDIIGDETDDSAWPDAERIRVWWGENRDAFVPGVRYLAGLPVGALELGTVLRIGNQQQRAAAALELALLNPEAPMLDVTAPAHRQIIREPRRN
jgi:uncharacterized protein (TIGR02270 family)